MRGLSVASSTRAMNSSLPIPSGRQIGHRRVDNRQQRLDERRCILGHHASSTPIDLSAWIGAMTGACLVSALRPFLAKLSVVTPTPKAGIRTALGTPGKREPNASKAGEFHDVPTS
jgi:hypothetical protein